ncbi:hypothetical protein FHX34_105757 [Actinoplanes teichomyceticus]|uniref:Uncharacterized protein n=1 Tax=Actinoplanes teichomyceticus TaxID=1867 RepID=A0A561VMP4_ACTTI|nr:hypothetical protein FHX34_105757 [Actinoplanes teichomyceticus]GIF13640.1 hypothetical protein Ate01nite_36720 [Actinoplanes teichomyceticus]
MPGRSHRSGRTSRQGTAARHPDTRRRHARQACGANIADLGEEHGHRVLKVRGKGGTVALVPLPPAVARTIDRAVDERDAGPRTTIRYDRARKNLDRHPNYILAAFMASGR